MDLIKDSVFQVTELIIPFFHPTSLANISRDPFLHIWD